jgi:hypothetical protein
MLALVRPDSWNFPLFLHVLGATMLVGSVAAVGILAVASLRHGWMRRIAVQTLLAVVIPSWLLMWLGGAWEDSKSPIGDDSTWLGIGYIVSDAGLVFLVVTTLIAAAGTRRPDRRWPPQAVAALSGIYLVALLVAMFAMSGKPGS